MAQLFFCRFKIFVLLLFICCQAASSQQTSPNEGRICQRYGEAQRCQQLVIEYSNRTILNQGQSPLDSPFGDNGAFLSKIRSKAILRQIETNLRANADQAKQIALQAISTSAATTQTGASPMANGSTNLVTKPTVTDFISFAAESGAFTGTVNGTTMTLQANALGLIKYFANQPVFERWNSKYADRVQPLTFLVTLNVAQNSTSTATTSGSANVATPSSIASIILPANNASFSSFGVNYAVYRRYNPQDPKFVDDWNKAVSVNQSALDKASAAMATVQNQLLTDASGENIRAATNGSLAAWHMEAAKAERTHNFEQLVSAYSKYDEAFCDAVLASSNDAPQQVLKLGEAQDVFDQVVSSILNAARGTPLASFSYLYAAPPEKPATHSANLSLSYLFRGDDQKLKSPLSGAQITGNFTTSVYANRPAGTAYGRLRDVQISGEFDKPFGGTLKDPRGTWSLAAYGQYQYDPSVLNIAAGNLLPGTNITLPGNAQVLLGTAGWLGVAQAKVVFNLTKGLSIPVALKWSNKTDLLKGSDVRGQIGLSYDLSALSKLITNKK